MEANKFYELVADELFEIALEEIKDSVYIPESLKQK